MAIKLKINPQITGDKEKDLSSLISDINKVMNRISFLNSRARKVIPFKSGNDDVKQVVGQINKAFNQIDPATTSSVMKINYYGDKIDQLVGEINKELNKVTSTI